MKEIGGYIELDKYQLPMLHDGAVALNCARNALAYLIHSRKIKKIQIPKFLCDSVRNVCKKENVEIKYYSIGLDFMPVDIQLASDEWLYIVNFYGQISNDILSDLANKYHRIIVDNVQAYFQAPLEHIDTIYTCRKFFGVPDGAFLYTNARMKQDLSRDESFKRMQFLLGRFERSASEFYTDYVANNEFFEKEPVKQMSLLTDNLLHAIDYDYIKNKRTQNFTVLHEAFAKNNLLKLTVPEGAFMYPLYVNNGEEIRKKLHALKIYIPTLWPDVFDVCDSSELECDMAKNILPLPVDQRYDEKDMQYLINTIKQ